MSNRFETEESRRELARRIAEESIVLLMNEPAEAGGKPVLPLAKGSHVAVIGRTQLDTVIGGSGSGASRNAHPVQILPELIRAGLVPAKALQEYYEKNAEAEAASAPKSDFDFSALEGLVNSGAIYEIFGKYTAPVPEPVPEDAVFAGAAAEADSAILVLGRASGGEECDRRVEDDYYLLPSERELIAATAAHFASIIVIFDVNGPMDTGWMADCPQVKAALFMGPSGEQAAAALADILVGDVIPSGKLTTTLAMCYEDYPTAANMSYNKDDPGNIRTYADYGLDAEANGSKGYAVSPVTVYTEDIFVGYRYFDTFEKPVMFPFGHGLSYASFVLQPAEEVALAILQGDLLARVQVRNHSAAFSGKEVVELYVAAPQHAGLPMPKKELKAFAKTDLLAPGAAEEVTLSLPLTELASFSEEEMAYVILPGNYTVLAGNSSAEESLVKIGTVRVPEKIVTRKVTADIGIQAVNKGKIDFLRPDAAPEDPAEGVSGRSDEGVLLLRSEDIERSWPFAAKYHFDEIPAEKSVLADVRHGKVRMEAFLNQMSVPELAAFMVGYGPGLPFGGIAAKDAPRTLTDENGEEIAYGSHKSANLGYMNPAMKKYGIYSACYQDGPASVGKTAWPTDMMIACTFNKDLAYAFGEAIGFEAASLDIDSWLGPGLNTIRNPIGGRNFEYFSEDPVVGGLMGLAVARGAQENNPVTSCPKHFAMNEQETYRRGKTSKHIDAVDSILSARAAREIYLKPFEMVITGAKPTTVMTSFNKINGTFAAGNTALCTGILRDEWGYDGVVVTDWGDMDEVVDGADAVHAGNDVVMPGGPPVIRQVLAGLEDGRVTVNDMKLAAAHLMNFVMYSRSFTDEAMTKTE